MSEDLTRLNEFQLKMLAKKELGREVLVWKKAELIRIIEDNRRLNPSTHKTSKRPVRPAKKGTTGTSTNFNRNNRKIPPPAPRTRKPSVANQDLRTHSAMELRDIAKDMGLTPTTFNKKKLISMIESKRLEKKVAPSNVGRLSPYSGPQKSTVQSRKNKFSFDAQPVRIGKVSTRFQQKTRQTPTRRTAPALPSTKVGSRPLPPRPTTAPPPSNDGSKALKVQLDAKERELQNILKQQKDQQETISSLMKEVSTIRKSLNSTEKRFQSQEDSMQRKMRQLEKDKESLQDRLTEAENDARRTQTQLMQMRQDTSAETYKAQLEQLKREMDMMKEASNRDKKQINQLTREKANLERNQAAVLKEKEDLAKRAADLENEKSLQSEKVQELESNISRWMDDYKALEVENTEMTKQLSQISTNSDVASKSAPPPKPVNLASPKTQNEGEPSEFSETVPNNISSPRSANTEFADSAYYNEFEANNLYNEIAIYDDNSSVRSAESGPATATDPKPYDRHLSIASDASLMAYGVPNPDALRDVEEDVTESDVLQRVLDAFPTAYPCEHWWYQDDSDPDNLQVCGPVSFEDFRQQPCIHLETYLWNGQNVPDWYRIQDLSGIQHLLPGNY